MLHQHCNIFKPCCQCNKINFVMHIIQVMFLMFTTSFPTFSHGQFKFEKHSKVFNLPSDLKDCISTYERQHLTTVFIAFFFSLYDYKCCSSNEGLQHIFLWKINKLSGIIVKQSLKFRLL